MALFNGLKFGRPNYPLYLADPYKVVEPTALVLLAQLSMMKSKTAKDEEAKTGKEQDIEAMSAETRHWYNLEAETKALKQQNEAMFSKIYSNDKKNFQNNKTFKEVIYPNMLKVEKNERLLKINKVLGKTYNEKFKEKVKKVSDMGQEGTFALDDNFNLVGGVDSEGRLIPISKENIGHAKTKGEVIKDINENLTTNKEGIFIEPIFPETYNEDAFNTKLFKQIENAKITESGRYVAGPQLTGIPGTFTTNTGEHIQNVRKLNEVTWKTLENNLTRGEKEAAYQMYYRALKDGAPYAFETEIYDMPDPNDPKKTVKAIRNKLDANKKPIPLSFEDYMTDVVTRGKMGVDINYYNQDQNWRNIPGWEDAFAKEKEIKSGWFWQVATGGKYWRQSAEEMNVNLGQILVGNLKTKNEDFYKNPYFNNLDQKDRVEIIMLNNYLHKPGNENKTMADYLKSQGSRSQEAGERLGSITKKQLTVDAKKQLIENYGKIKTLKNENLITPSRLNKTSESDVNIIGSLLDNKTYYNAMVGGAFTPMSYDRQEASSYALGTPISADETLYGFDHTPFKLGTKDGKTPTIVSATQVIHIPKLDNNGNPLESDNGDESFVLTHIMVTPDRLQEMYGIFKGQLKSYSDEDLKALMDQYTIKTTFRDVAKTMDANGNEVINYAKFKSSGYTSENLSDNVVLVPVLISGKHLILDALNNKGVEPITTTTTTNFDNTSDINEK